GQNLVAGVSMTRSMSETNQPLSRAGQKFVAILLLGLLVPIATYSRELLGEPGSIALGTLLFGGIIALIAHASEVRSIPYPLLIIGMSALPLVCVYTVSALVSPDVQAVS